MSKLHSILQLITQIRHEGHASEGKPQLRKGGSRLSRTVNRNRQIGSTQMGNEPHNLIHLPQQICGCCPTSSIQCILNKQSRGVIYKEIYNPQFLLPRTILNICKQQSDEGHPKSTILLIVPPNFAPHYCSHANQIVIKQHLDSKN